MTKILGVSALALLAMAAQAHAEEGRFFARAGVANLDLSPGSVEMSVGGAAVPGADFTVAQDTVGVFEAGWFFHDNFAVSGMVTSEATTDNVGAGSLAGVPIGQDSFILAAGLGQYHFDLHPRVQPYIGGGVAWFHPTDTQDGAVTNLSIDDSLGGVLQVGLTAPIGDRFGVYADMKQFFIGIDATGSLGAPVIASADIDPAMLSVGGVLRF